MSGVSTPAQLRNTRGALHNEPEPGILARLSRVHPATATLIALLIIGILQGADLVTTHYALSMGSQEGNPFMAAIVTDPLLMLNAKVFLVLVAATTGLHALKHKAHRIGIAGLAVVIGFYCLVIGNNALAIAENLGWWC